MDRRRLLAASGALLAAALAGCTESESAAGPTDTPAETPTSRSPPTTPTGTETPTDEPTPTETDEPTATLTGTDRVPDETLQQLAEDNAAFALDLHRHLADSTGGNLFVSPYSVSVALAMVYAGAEGDTRTQMRETLHYALGDDLHPAFADLQGSLEGGAEDERISGGYQLSGANAVWGREGFPFVDSYRDVLRTYYGTGVREAAFGTDPEGERQRINEWVADQTDGRIEELLPRDALDMRTLLVLINAIYFSGKWRWQFDPEETTEATFTALDGTEPTVPMMRLEIPEAPVASVDGAEALELPYRGRQVSMVLILPDEGTFESYEASLDAERLFGIFDALERGSGEVRLPRFEFETSLELSDVLAPLGMPAAFDRNSANFDGSDDRILLDEVYHDAFVAVDETGTEAAAATGAVTIAGSSSLVPFDLTFDRPFLFCIRDRLTDTVVFLGRVVDAGAAQ
jgi:serpin B